ncbi:DUF2695 domain-containing protein, partial [Chitinimonas sp. PSY-7]|uniref:DUF2695 domain-containing protein n=1 Tax=Chitinimonas sp. PSY-7 TaxID=3459088 RepID=UPI0040400E93
TFQQWANGFKLFATDVAGVSGSHWASIAGLGLDEKTLNRFLETTCDDTLEYTRLWLAEYAPHKINSVLEAMGDRGGYCDCEVLANVVL